MGAATASRGGTREIVIRSAGAWHGKPSSLRSPTCPFGRGHVTGRRSSSDSASTGGCGWGAKRGSRKKGSPAKSSNCTCARWPTSVTGSNTSYRVGTRSNSHSMSARPEVNLHYTSAGNKGSYSYARIVVHAGGGCDKFRAHKIIGPVAAGHISCEANMNNVLVSWVGRMDLRAASGDPEAGLGPLGQAVDCGRFDEFHLMCNFPQKDMDAYLNWIRTRTQCRVVPHRVKLSGPTTFEQIYEGVLGKVTNVLRK